MGQMLVAESNLEACQDPSALARFRLPLLMGEVRVQGCDHVAPKAQFAGRLLVSGRNPYLRRFKSRQSLAGSPHPSAALANADIRCVQRNAETKESVAVLEAHEVGQERDGCCNGDPILLCHIQMTNITSTFRGCPLLAKSKAFQL
jgi:hypothetical protein